MSRTKNEIIVDYSKCSHCGLCISVCDSKILGIDSNQNIEVQAKKKCKECGHCIAICPNNALRFENDGEYPEVPKLSEELREDLTYFLRSKRSIRHYQNKPVEREKIEQIISSGTYAPTAKNRQWRYFIVIQDPDMISNIEKEIIYTIPKQQKMLKFANSRFGRRLINDPEASELIQYLLWDNEEIMKNATINTKTNPIFYGAPCLIITYAWKNTGINGDIFAAEHCYYAQTYMMLQAHALGLGSGIIGYASTQTKILEKYIEIPKNHKIYGIFTLGYPQYQFNRIISRKKPDIKWC